MTIEMLKGLPFSVDTWSSSSSRKRHHFLTHAHKDHTLGICTHASSPIYCTLITQSLVLQHYPQLDRSIFVRIEVGQSLEIEDPNGGFMVTAFDANHCPGAVMFLFEGKFGNILHTGDCRLTIECLRSLPEKYVGKKGKQPRCPLDCVFLDCTFGTFPLRMPTKQSAIQQVINCIWKHPDAPTVYLTCDLLGHEEILVSVSRTFGCKIYIDKAKIPQCFQSMELLVPKILSQDPMSRFQLFDGFHGLYDRAEAKIAEARANFQHEPLIIRASSQWYACGDEGCSQMEKPKKERFDQAVRDVHGVWHVCYSIHSSREELEWALQILAPRWVVSTTPCCRAMELDYVKKHCFNRKRDMDDPFLKLLEIDVGASSQGILEEASSPSQVTSDGNIEILTQLAVSPRRQLQQHVSAPRKRPVTLFGRARHGVVGPAFTIEVKKECVHVKAERNVFLNSVTEGGDKNELEYSKDSKTDINKHEESNGSSEIVTMEEEKESWLDEKEGSNVFDRSIHTSADLELHKSAECNSTDDIKEHHERSVSSAMHNGSSKRFSASMKRFYRSMNASVPQPLPSLVELMAANRKRARRLLCL